MTSSFSPRCGFSLVELSIVLVILGLLVGGVLSGRSLIRAAELRAATREFQHYQIAVYSFQERYGALPGDLPNATSFWGAEPAAHCPGDETTPSTGKATCNGNGNGRLSWQGSTGYGAESHRFWQHLANAGLISGQYTGVQAGGECNYDGSCNVRLGWNAPASKLGNAGWSINTLSTVTPEGKFWFAGEYGTTLFYGAVGNFTTNPALTPTEAWSIDSKTDDGHPATGFVRAPKQDFWPDCTDSNSTDAAYRTEIDRTACALLLLTGF